MRDVELLIEKAGVRGQEKENRSAGLLPGKCRAVGQAPESPLKDKKRVAGFDLYEPPVEP
jgi:hypothetical protein